MLLLPFIYSAIDWKQILSRFNKRQSFGTMVKLAVEVKPQLAPLVSTQYNSIFNEEIDTICSDPGLLPTAHRIEYPTHVPVTINGDANCMPRCVERFVTGCYSDMFAEYRVRLLVEMLLNKEWYLTDTYLNRGFEPTETLTNTITSRYASCTKYYLADSKMDIRDSRVIEKCYEDEVFHLGKSKMGLWQLHALANVLRRPVNSVNPHSGSRWHGAESTRTFYPEADTWAKSNARLFMVWKKPEGKRDQPCVILLR